MLKELFLNFLFFTESHFECFFNIWLDQVAEFDLQDFVTKYFLNSGVLFSMTLGLVANVSTINEQMVNCKRTF